MTMVRAGGADLTGEPPPCVARIVVTRATGRSRCTLGTGHLSARLIDQDAHGARVALVATGALLLGGDHVRVDIHVGPDAWLDVVETAGTVAYDAAGVRSSWHVSADVGVRGVLTWAGLPFVVADGADVDRRTDITLGAGARACVRDTLVLGRAGEQGGALRSRTHITIEDVPLLVEELDLGPAGRSAGILGDYRVLDSVTIAGHRPSDEHQDGQTLQLDLAGPGAIARYLGHVAHASCLDQVWNRWARHATG